MFSNEMFYNNSMERLLEIVGILTALYIGYKLTIGKWDYSSPQKRDERKNKLKTAGLSTRFYFMHPRTQFILTFISGGLFTFYWLFKQWQQVLRGFKRLDNTPLKGSTFTRTLGGVWSFFALAGLINRTCEYMHKPTSWPAGLWGLLWLGGLALTFCPVEVSWRLTGYALWCAAPAVFQRRINTLSHEQIPAFPRTVEIIAALLCGACATGIISIVRMCLK